MALHSAKFPNTIKKHHIFSIIGRVYQESKAVISKTANSIQEIKRTENRFKVAPLNSCKIASAEI